MIRVWCRIPQIVQFSMKNNYYVQRQYANANVGTNDRHREFSKDRKFECKLPNQRRIRVIRRLEVRRIAKITEPRTRPVQTSSSIRVYAILKQEIFENTKRICYFSRKIPLCDIFLRNFGFIACPFFFFIGTCVFFFTETFENVNNENFLNIGNMDTYMDFRLGKYSPEIFCTVLYAWWKEGGSVIVAIE